MTLRLIIVFITLLLAKQPEIQKTEIYGHWKLIKLKPKMRFLDQNKMTISYKSPQKRLAIISKLINANR